MAHRLQRLRDFIFQKVEVEFESDFPLAEAVARLEKDTWRSVFASFSQEFVAGRVQADDVRLQAVQPFFGNSFNEVQTYTRAFMTLWLGLAAFITALSVVGSLVIPNDEVMPLFPFIPLAFLAFGVGFVRWGWWCSSDDIVVVNTVIKRALTPHRAADAHKQSSPR